MSATIIQFPADRCRQPASAIELAEQEAYARVAEQSDACFDRPSIQAMMRLAVEGTCAVTKAKAAAWLYAEMNVLVR